MEAKELRIGNFVTDEWNDSFPKIITVESMDNKGVNLTIEDDGNWSELAQHFIVPEYKFDELRGIPLTEEWLLNLGAKKENPPFDGIFVFNGNIPVSQIINYGKSTIKNIIHDYGFVSHNGAGSIDIKITYVHQLQNLFFALTGKEITLIP